MMNHKVRAYFVILGGMLVHLSLGTIYTLGNMIPYMVSYLRVYSQSRDLRNTGAVWVQSAALTGQAVGMAISGILQLRLSTRVTTAIGGVVMSAGVAVSYFTIKQSFWLLLFTYGFLFGVGLGIAYTPCFNCAMKWLPAKKGLVTGLVMTGFGGGAFVFNQIQTVFINPDNFTPDAAITAGSNEKYFSRPEVLDRVPLCFLVLAGCYTGLQIIGIALLSDPPAKDLQKPLEIPRSGSTQDTTNGVSDNNGVGAGTANGGHHNKAFETEKTCEATDETIQLQNLGVKTSTSGYTEEEEDEVKRTELKQKQYSVLEMAKTKEFWILYITLLLNGQGTILITSMYKAFGQTFISDDHLLALVGSFSALFNSSGRPMWGYLADVFTYKVAMMCLCSCMCVILFTLELTRLGGEVMFFVWVCAFYLSLCGNYSMMPAVVARTFGTERVGVNYSIVFTSQIFTSFIGAVLASQLKDAIGWFGLFHLTGGLIFLSLLLTAVFNGRNPDGSPV